MRWLACAAIAAACAPSLDRVRADAAAANRRALTGANADAARAGIELAPATFDAALPPASGPDAVTIAARAGAHGLIAAEQLVARLETGELAFASDGCAVALDVCGVCARPVSYRYFRAGDGHVVIVRLVPDYQIRQVEAAQCTIGECGIPAPPVPPPTTVHAHRLGTSSLAAVELRELRYTQVVVVTTCKHPFAVP